MFCMHVCVRVNNWNWNYCDVYERLCRQSHFEWFAHVVVTVPCVPVFPVGRPTQWWQQLCQPKKGWQHTDCETQVQWPWQHHGLFPWPHAAFVLSVSICAAVRRPAFQAGLSCEWHLPISASVLLFILSWKYTVRCLWFLLPAPITISPSHSLWQWQSLQDIADSQLNNTCVQTVALCLWTRIKVAMGCSCQGSYVCVCTFSIFWVFAYFTSVIVR